ncbi:excisionase family DNA-binding protein [Azohydromonas lata]|uniref:Excisionase family DNA-binding protein n=1 Tax=Azohydromonas lata TaxID=45677 RepID=A0ABU5IHQ3_9BURK|nr:excisionase family DNA-binding protein [Azohydromonas lata]MDZ5458599.1 excisionase family DNA-binding protein [Azohydromonas lata]
MPRQTTSSTSSTRSTGGVAAARNADPLGPLADAVGEALANHIVEVPVGKGRRVVMDLEEVDVSDGGTGLVSPRLRNHLKSLVARALEASLSARTEEGRRLRMAMVGRLATLELGDESRGGEAPAADLAAAASSPLEADVLLTTAQAASRLGVSRPHVAMLCDAGKLGEVAVTDGGHRRISRAAVETYFAAQSRVADVSDTPREAGSAGGLYTRPDADFVDAGRRQAPAGAGTPARPAKRRAGR